MSIIVTLLKVIQLSVILLCAILQNGVTLPNVTQLSVILLCEILQNAIKCHFALFHSTEC